MRRQGKIPADIARTGLVSDAAVSKLLNLPQRMENRDELDERIGHLASTLKYKASKDRAIEFLEFLKLQEERGTYNAPENQKPASSEIVQ